MTSQIKLNGSWKEFNPIVKVNGVWKFCNYGYIKVLGQWKPFFIKNAGYFMGGVNQVPDGGSLTDLSTISKFSFESELQSVISSTLSAQTRAGTMPGLSNSGVAGYLAGGEAGSSVYNKIEKLSYLTESRSLLSATISGSVLAIGGLSYTGISGYIAGGYQTSPTSTWLSRIDKINYLTDTKSTLSATLGTANGNQSCVSNPKIAGYLRGGSNGGTRLEKLTFSSETMSTISTSLAWTDTGTGITESSINGYWNGIAASLSTRVQIIKMPYSTQTESNLGNKLSQVRQWPGAVTNYLTNGYWLGGNSSGPGLNVSGMDRFVYSTSVCSALPTTLISPVRQTGSLSNNGVL